MKPKYQKKSSVRKANPTNNIHYRINDEMNQQSITFTVVASPPSDVSLYLLFISTAVAHIVLTTSSKGTFTSAGSLSIAISAALIALMAPIEFLSIQGICTKPAIGSHVI